MAIPTWTSGEVLTASDVNSYFVPIAAVKTSNTDRTTLTKSDDPDLSVSVEASAYYVVEAVLVYFCTSTTPNFAWTWTTPSGAGSSGYFATYNGSSDSQVHEWNLWSETHTAGVNPTSTSLPVFIHGTLLTSSAGTFALNWAEATSTAAAMTLSARSHLTLQRIS